MPPTRLAQPRPAPLRDRRWTTSARGQPRSVDPSNGSLHDPCPATTRLRHEPRHGSGTSHDTAPAQTSAWFRSDPPCGSISLPHTHTFAGEHNHGGAEDTMVNPARQPHAFSLAAGEHRGYLSQDPGCSPSAIPGLGPDFIFPSILHHEYSVTAMSQQYLARSTPPR